MAEISQRQKYERQLAELRLKGVPGLLDADRVPMMQQTIYAQGGLSGVTITRVTVPPPIRAVGATNQFFDERLVTVLANLVNRADVGMVQSGSSTGFTSSTRCRATSMAPATISIFTARMCCRRSSGGLASTERRWSIGGLREGWAWAPRRWTQVSADTGTGNPTLATPEKGARYAELVTSKVADFLVELAAADAAALYID